MRETIEVIEHCSIAIDKVSVAGTLLLFYFPGLPSIIISDVKASTEQQQGPDHAPLGIVSAQCPSIPF